MPLKRDHLKSIRILFLGGSTTYGRAIPTNEYTYPDWIGKKLQLELKRNVEIINAGLPMGTSAELLTHYLFKYRYNKPDIVVINTGGNDVISLSLKYYHPDYSHTRQQLSVINPINDFGKVLLRSHFLSLIIVPAISQRTKPNFLSIANLSPKRPPKSIWYPDMNLQDFRNSSFPEIPLERNAFKKIFQLLSEKLRPITLKLFYLSFGKPLLIIILKDG